jgi:hypothetical protein
MRISRAFSLQLSVFSLFLLLAGCTLWPSTWRLGGSPLDKHERAAQKLAAAQSEAVGAAQAAVHKAEAAIAVAPPSRPVAVASDFVSQARALLDQAHGAPSAADEAAWRQLVAGLVSENAAIRTAAEKQHAAAIATTADLAHRLAAATATAERANTRALDYARQSEALADFARKLKLGFYALVGLLVLGTVLSLAARFVPALGAAAKVVNAIAAPGITYAATRAEAGLRKVGTALAEMRGSLPAATAAQITDRLDVATDADHQRLIAAGAAAMNG